jgi:hypothetical protein
VIEEVNSSLIYLIHCKKFVSATVYPQNNNKEKKKKKIAPESKKEKK